MTEYIDAEIVGQKRGFWQSVGGQILRWIFFLPVGLTLAGLIEFGVILGTVWLFGANVKFFIIVGILFGGLFTVLPIIAMLYYFSIMLACKLIAPRPKIGTIIFATLFVLYGIRSFATLFTSGMGSGVIVPSVIWKVIFLITAIVAFVQSYNETE